MWMCVRAALSTLQVLVSIVLVSLIHSKFLGVMGHAPKGVWRGVSVVDEAEGCMGGAC